MPLDDLVSVIETLQQRIATHRQSLQGNEIRTRTALIDPLLTALGWDVSDPALVTPEYNVGEGRADYALKGSDSIPAAVVEAKRLGHALNDDERMQMLNYANARGVRYAAVTDGDVWELYEVFKQAPLEDRRLLNLSLANRSAHELSLQLLMLWRPNVSSGQPVEARESILTIIRPIDTQDSSAVPEEPLATQRRNHSPRLQSGEMGTRNNLRRGRPPWVHPNQPGNVFSLGEAYQLAKTEESEREIQNISDRIANGELRQSSKGNMAWNVRKRAVLAAGYTQQ